MADRQRAADAGVSPERAVRAPAPEAGAVTTAALVTLDEIRAAAGRIHGVALRTPVVDVALPAEPHIRQGATLALKCENLQPMGAFKIRGACNMLAQLPREARAAGVITYSSGNHGQ